MGALDLILLFIILTVLFITLGLLWINIPGLPGQSVKQNEYNSGEFLNSISGDIQFYPRMRYKNSTISYSTSGSCNASKKNDIERAFNFLSQKTILKFKNTPNGEISILCSNIDPKPEEKKHFIAGEGGPSEIINTTRYAVIFSGKVSLYRRAGDCDNPNVAIHEILHALGFNHNENKKSIMYPITGCDQVLDDYIIDYINEIYKIESAPDLAIEKVRASQTGRYLDFEATIGNLGLQDSTNSSLIIYADNIEVKLFTLERLEIGTKKVLKVKYLKMPLNFEEIYFEIKSQEKEISKDNNKIRLKLESIS